MFCSSTFAGVRRLGAAGAMYQREGHFHMLRGVEGGLLAQDRLDV